jgi:FkbM family methyltransferase
MAMKKIIKDNLRRFGVDIVRHPPLPTIVFDLRNFLTRYAINVVFDVGAHQGNFAKMLRKDVRYDGRIVSFEPFSESFAALERTMKDDKNWMGYNFGLSSKNGTAELNIFGGKSDFNSLLPLREAGEQTYGIEGSTISSIQLRTLDSAWDLVTDGITSPRAFLKMDTQGHDTYVLLGALMKSEQIIGLQSELPAVEIYEGMQSMSEMISFYKEHGYTPHCFYPVNRPDAYNGAPLEFDVIFGRNRR